MSRAEIRRASIHITASDTKTGRPPASMRTRWDRAIETSAEFQRRRGAACGAHGTGCGDARCNTRRVDRRSNGIGWSLVKSAVAGAVSGFGLLISPSEANPYDKTLRMISGEQTNEGDQRSGGRGSVRSVYVESAAGTGPRFDFRSSRGLDQSVANAVSDRDDRRHPAWRHYAR